MPLIIHRSRRTPRDDRRTPTPCAQRTVVLRHGFTLIELMVALVLLDLALLAVAASSAVAARQLAVARAGSRAAAVAQSRLEWAVTQPCGDPMAGTVTWDRGIRESWSVSSPERETRLVTDTVEFTFRGNLSRQVVVSRVTC